MALTYPINRRMKIAIFRGSGRTQPRLAWRGFRHGSCPLRRRDASQERERKPGLGTESLAFRKLKLRASDSQRPNPLYSHRWLDGRR
jgi:hypothetical protein